jgi:hypothetical protein
MPRKILEPKRETDRRFGEACAVKRHMVYIVFNDSEWRIRWRFMWQAQARDEKCI